MAKIKSIWQNWSDTEQFLFAYGIAHIVGGVLMAVGIWVQTRG